MLNEYEEIYDEKWDSDEDKEEYYVQLVNSLLRDSKRDRQDIRKQWKVADDRLNMPALSTPTNPAKTDIDTIGQAIEEAIALKVESLPVPQVESRGPHDENFAGMLNQAMEQELTANHFSSTCMAGVVYDQMRFSMGVVQVLWDNSLPGLFGSKPGRNIVKRIDPRYVHLDPHAEGYLRHEGRYLIIEKPMDISDIRAIFPDKIVEPEGAYSRSPDDESKSEFTPQSSSGREMRPGYRDRAVLKELWLNSVNMIKRPKKLEDGSLAVDQEGKTVYEVAKKYPNGRLIIIANKTLLFDGPNPYDGHGHYPYVFFPEQITNRLYNEGPISKLIRIEDKKNQLAKDAYRNLRVNLNSPWRVDRHAFDSPKKFNMLTNDPGLVLPTAPGAKVERIPAGDLPPSLFGFMEYLEGVFDKELGVAGIMRGQLEKGSQLSADAVNSLQASSTARIRFKARLLEQSLIHLGHLLQWNIRQFYDTGMAIQVPIPGTDKQQELQWSANAAKAQYQVLIEAGSGLPGAKESGNNLMRQLYKEGIISRPYCIRGMKLPGAEKLIKEMDDREKELLQLGIKSALKKPGGK